MPSLERDISEPDIIQNTRITSEKCFCIFVTKNLVGIWNGNKWTDWFWLGKSSK